MGVAKTGAIFKTFSFDGESSRDYGVYITGSAVYNAPERDVEMITIPGRNGSFAKDNGRFENIEVTYPAGIYADTEEDYAEAVSNFRNMLCSKVGYCRLEDEYNPDEYRMAVYKSGLEVDSALLRAGEFNLTFECKPQRFLKSGEVRTRWESDRNLNNPTLFDAHPLLEFSGFGTINIGDQTITVNNATYGHIKVGEYTKSTTSPVVQTVTTTNLNVADLFDIGDFIGQHVSISIKPIGSTISNVSLTNSGTYSYATGISTYKALSIDLAWREFKYGTSKTITGTTTYTLTFANNNTYTGTVTLQLAYNGTDRFTFTITANSSSPSNYTIKMEDSSMPIMYATSTKEIESHDVVLDLDMGEAWERDDPSISLNNSIELPAQLPVLKPGNNMITYTNRFLYFYITPRWWKL